MKSSLPGYYLPSECNQYSKVTTVDELAVEYDDEDEYKDEKQADGDGQDAGKTHFGWERGCFDAQLVYGSSL